MQDDIAHLYCNAINYSITHRYSLQIWKQIVNTMILKQENNIRIQRLRVVHIVEADLNFILGENREQLFRKGGKNERYTAGNMGGVLEDKHKQ